MLPFQQATEVRKREKDEGGKKESEEGKIEQRRVIFSSRVCSVPWLQQQRNTELFLDRLPVTRGNRAHTHTAASLHHGNAASPHPIIGISQLMYENKPRESENHIYSHLILSELTE